MIIYICVCLFIQQTHFNDLCVAPSFLNSVSSENEGMHWRETSTFDSLSFGTLYADTGSQDRRKQVQVLLCRMDNSRDSGAASLPRPTHEESTEGQVNETVTATDESKRGGGAHLESLRMDEQHLPDGSGSSVPFWAKTIWLLDQLAILQGPHGAGREAMRVEVRREHLLEDSFNQVGWPSWWCFEKIVFERLLTFATTYIFLCEDDVIQS